MIFSILVILPQRGCTLMALLRLLLLVAAPLGVPGPRVRAAALAAGAAMEAGGAKGLTRARARARQEEKAKERLERVRTRKAKAKQKVRPQSLLLVRRLGTRLGQLILLLANLYAGIGSILKLMVVA